MKLKNKDLFICKNIKSYDFTLSIETVPKWSSIDVWDSEYFTITKLFYSNLSYEFSYPRFDIEGEF